jgi:dipeptidyl aminopeptidase/acylaminoacyl peptidase
MKSCIAFVLILVGSSIFAQKKTLDHTVYNDWKSLKNSIVSDNGRYISYEITPHRGDGYLYLYDKESSNLYSFFRAKDAQFSKESDFFAFKRTAGFDTLRTCELKKIDKKKWPKDTLVIFRLSDRDQKSIPLLKSFSVNEKTNWLAYSIDSNFVEKKEKATVKKKKFTLFKKKKETPKKKEVKITSDGNLVYLYQPATDTKLEFNDVTEFKFSPNGEFFLYKQQKKVDKAEQFRLFVYDFAKKESFQIDTTRSSITNFTVSKSDKFLAYLASSDTTKVKNSKFQLYDLKDRQNYIALDSTNISVDSNQMVSDQQDFIFTDNEKYLFLGVDDFAKDEPDDSLLPTEKAKLDLWHYQDQRLQPQQLKELKKDQAKTKLQVLHLDNFELIAVGNDSLSARPNAHLEGDYLLLTNVDPYQGTYNWTYPNQEDHYRVSLIDGSVELLRKGVSMGGELSPSGKYYTYFDDNLRQHFAVDLTTKTSTCLTCDAKKMNWQEDVNGMPYTPYALGLLGWKRGEDQVYMQSEFDIWKYSFDDKKLTSITNGEGYLEKIEFNLRLWNRDSLYISAENSYLTAQNKKTKDQAIYQWIDHGEHNDLINLYQSPHALTSIARSENKETILLRKSNLQDYADVFVLDKNFKNAKRISNTNPQQSEYNWATVELLDYKSYDGQNLQALFYKPEDFDASKSYPLLVYYYELYTDNIHNHYAPKPTASIIFPTEYASAGYVVLIPDIRYKEGHPGKSAYNCIMGSTDAALKKYTNIDSTRMGLQGQSWGGYQTAQMVTMTTRYKAAMAGAPVSNMFSAYGGIRWGSGYNRQFQYEHTQSRIGKTIWEAPELYVENSPLFHLPKVKTPLLIMHNDEDGAVPWYQGIELFTGMKRLGKPCWLLNYNGDDHNLMKNANRIDLSIRMRQFFDYYLLNAPAPKWLIDGIPATEKGKEYRLELVGE